MATAGSLAQLRSAAFGATPGADVFAAAAAADPRARWLAAVVLGGQGHYAAAATALRDLLGNPPGNRLGYLPGGLLAHPAPPWASLAASTLASHRRQLGAHAAARRLDALALRLTRPQPPRSRNDAPPHLPRDPDGVDAAGARADALIGLAADAIGLGELGAAGRLLAAADATTDAGHRAWRLAVRLDWVRAELSLASGSPADAIEPARRALRRAEEAAALRHVAKSQLVLAAALHASGDHPTADALLHDLTAVADEHGLVPLRWPAELLLTQLHGTTHASADRGTPTGTEHAEHHRAAASTALRVVLRRADATLRTAAKSSLWVPSEVLQTGDSAERSSAGEILSKFCIRLCQGSTPRDR